MGKINFTKQESRKEGNKVFVDINQQLEYDVENVKNVLHDLKEQKTEATKFIENYNEFEKECYDRVHKTFDENIKIIHEMLSMTDEELKEKLFEDFNKNKPKLQETLDKKEKKRKELIAIEHKRVTEMKHNILDELKRIDKGIELYSSALENKE